ncbi:MAG: VWA domain-containing protein [Patescibacteria group bacterium]
MDIFGIRFLRPEYLNYSLAAAGLLILGFIFFLILKKRNIPGDKEVIKYSGVFPSKTAWLAEFLLLLIILFGFFGFLARPLVVFEEKNRFYRGPNVIFAVDASDSMLREAAVNGLPSLPVGTRPHALAAVQAKIKEIVENHNHFQAALIYFQRHAGVTTAFLPVPEKRAEFLEGLKSAPIYAPGSDIFKALSGAVNLFETIKNGEQQGKMIVLFSDGAEEKAATVASSDLAILKEIKKKNIRVAIIGVGSSNWGLIKKYDPIAGKFLPLRDPGKNLVKTRRYDKILEEIARLTQGEYFLFENYNRLASKKNKQTFNNFFQEIIERHKTLLGEKTVKKETDVGWYLFLAGTAAFLAVSGFVNGLFRWAGYIADLKKEGK